jgi:hypothetical protein
LRGSRGQQIEGGLLRPAEQKGLDNPELHVGAWVVPGERRCEFDTFRAALHHQLGQNIMARVLRQSGEPRAGI